MDAKLRIVGCGTKLEDLSAPMLRAIETAGVLYGGRRLLAWFEHTRATKIPVGASLDEDIRALVRRVRAGESVVVLASGDPLFFGIANRILAHLPLEAVEIHPGISSMQRACSRFGVDWGQAAFFTAHGRDEPLPWRRILQSRRAIILCDHRNTPQRIAGELVRRFPAGSGREAHVAEELGLPGERFVSTSLEAVSAMTFGGLSLLLLGEERNPGALPPISLGLPEDEYAREANLITHEEVRAVALAKLRLCPGVLWDVGAGSGSVGIEAAGLVPGLRVFSIERNAARAEQIRTNAGRHGVANVSVVEGKFFGVAEALPDPDRVFVGGGGREAGRIVERCLARLRPGGRIVVSAVLEETIRQLGDAGLKPHLHECVEVAARRSVALAHSHVMRPLNAVRLFVFEKPGVP